MDFKQLEAFVSVVELSSFSKAAEKLFLTQPTITARIHALEKKLGVNLLLRSTRSVTPSHWGALLYQQATELLALRTQTLQMFDKAKEKENNSIDIAASTIPAQYVLPQLITAFRKQYPTITFSVLEKDSKQVIDSILSQKAEIGFTGTKIEENNCIFLPFMEDSLVIVAPYSSLHPEKNSQHVSNAWLQNTPFIIREQGSGTRTETERFLKELRIDLEDLNIVAEVNSPEQVIQFVTKGMGISILSLHAAKEAENRNLVKIYTIDQLDMNRNLYLVYHKHRPLSRAAKMFVQKIQNKQQ